ncbi:hypothetical protein LCY76_22840 [Fictibacillus sp. KIGAM418]|uniref:DUF5050 domain-containing protein n=1 Tax=Fictibacillus marinisediminis TaxID=2878389 RepID=A0A9X1XGL0_9BACL|nr:hypothetical protein [Fictibacillus marinisediminis]MCK6259413.1 hypothetical protein [Fictibacillus marinisediminis]
MNKKGLTVSLLVGSLLLSGCGKAEEVKKVKAAPAIVNNLKHLKHENPLGGNSFDPERLMYASADEMSFEEVPYDNGVDNDEAFYAIKDPEFIDLDVFEDNGETQSYWMQSKGYEFTKRENGDDKSGNDKTIFSIYRSTIEDDKWSNTDQLAFEFSVNNIGKVKDGEYVPAAEEKILDNASKPVFNDIPKGYHFTGVDLINNSLYFSFVKNNKETDEEQNLLVKRVLLEKEQNKIDTIYDGVYGETSFLNTAAGPRMYVYIGRIYYICKEIGQAPFKYTDTTNLLENEGYLSFMDDSFLYVYSDGLKKVNLVTGDPLFTKNGDDRVAEGTQVVDVDKDHIYIIDQEKNQFLVYDKNLKKLSTSPDFKWEDEGFNEYEFYATKDRIHVWQQVEYQRKEAIEKIQITKLENKIK